MEVWKLLNLQKITVTISDWPASHTKQNNTQVL